MSDETDEGSARTVPYDKFAAARKDRADALAQLAELTDKLTAAEQELGALRTASQGWDRERADALSRIAATEQRYERHAAAWSAGLTDPDVVAAAEWAYGRMPEEGRPSFSDALAAWKADAEQAPVVLRPFLSPASPPPAVAGGGAPPPRLPAAGRSLTVDDIAQARAEGRYADVRQALIAEAQAGRR